MTVAHESGMYRQMVTIRLLEERLQELCSAGKAGDLHFNRGQEAIAVGVLSALRPTDYTVTHHRTIAHAVAKGADLRKLVAELLGKKTGYNGGRAGEMHLSIPEIRHAFSFQIVGTCVPVAVGLAWALRYFQRTDDVVACFIGDAATSNGQVHEGLTIAATKKVPLLLVCENNGRAGNVTQEVYMPTAYVDQRLSGAYGLQTFRVNGNSVEDVARAARSALGIAVERRPVLLECLTERLCHHKQGQGDIRSKEALAELAMYEPIRGYERLLRLTEEQIREVRASCLSRVNEAIAQAEADPLAEF